MRKFNLKGTVVQRMKGIVREEAGTNEKSPPEKQTLPEMKAMFTPEQGTIHYAWRTDTGRLRKINQDTVILGNGLAGVADGMGGHRGGEIASAGLRDGLLRETKDCHPDQNKLADAVKTVNKELWLRQEKDSSLSGMGTTLTVLWPSEGQMIVGQVGDSRAYLLRNGILEQVTEDHSMVADMVRKGVLTEEQAACHPMRNYITRAVGTDDHVEIDITVHNRKQGDRWLICSDGLYGMMNKDTLHLLLSGDDLEQSADELLRAALDGGGKDNISLVILDDETITPEDNNESNHDQSNLADDIDVTDPSQEVAQQ